MPIHELTSRLGVIPPRRIWTHCVSGFRAGITASLLAGAGHDVSLIDDHIDHARALRLLVS